MSAHTLPCVEVFSSYLTVCAGCQLIIYDVHKLSAHSFLCMHAVNKYITICRGFQLILCRVRTLSTLNKRCMVLISYFAKFAGCHFTLCKAVSSMIILCGFSSSQFISCCVCKLSALSSICFRPSVYIFHCLPSTSYVDCSIRLST